MILLPIFDGEVPDMDDRLAQFADDATATLAADPELRLEARAGLLAQLKERSEAFRAAGHEEDESNGLALDAFGDPKELAGKLRAANMVSMATCIRSGLIALGAGAGKSADGAGDVL